MEGDGLSNALPFATAHAAAFAISPHKPSRSTPSALRWWLLSLELGIDDSLGRNIMTCITPNTVDC
jgi:hypothetical protein